MKFIPLTSAVPLLILSGFALAQPCESDDALIEQLSEAIDREIVIYPSICSFEGITASDDIDKESLLAILKANNLAFETEDLILILPGSINIIPTRLLQENDLGVSDHEIVARVIRLPAEATQTVTAPRLVPLLRPMMPQIANLSAVRDTNTLIFIDRYDNIRRLTLILEEIVEQARPATVNP